MINCAHKSLAHLNVRLVELVLEEVLLLTLSIQRLVQVEVYLDDLVANGLRVTLIAQLKWLLSSLVVHFNVCSNRSAIGVARCHLFLTYRTHHQRNLPLF